jgi:hypothetical protein
MGQTVTSNPLSVETDKNKESTKAAAAAAPAVLAQLSAAADPQFAQTELTPAEVHRRDLIRTLSRGNSLPTLIADTQQFDLRQACRVTRIALEDDPDFDRKLVDLIKSGAAGPDQIIRVLAVLESVCQPSRLLGHVLGLKYVEGRVRSKLTLMIGRLSGDPAWLRRQLEDESPRIRANAIEGLWDLRTQGLDELLRASLRDPHQRVAANAALGLHKIGDVAAIASLFAMLRHPDEMFRRAAVWAIGQARDPRFLPAVEELAARTTGDELLAAQRVREELRTTRATAEFTSALSLEVSRETILASGRRTIRLACVADSIAGWLGPLELNALNFVITEGETQIEDYSLRWVNNDEPVSILLIQPRTWNGSGELFRLAIRSAGPTEKFGFLPYQTLNSPVRGKEHDDAAEVAFGTYQEMSKDYLGHRYDVAKTVGFALKVGLSGLNRQAGSRHLLLLADPSVGDADPPAELASLQPAGTQIHAVVWDNAKPEFCDAFKEAAQKSGGQFMLASSARDFTRTLLSVRAAELGSLELSWQAKDSAVKAPARIVCHSTYGYGEVLLKRS